MGELGTPKSDEQLSFKFKDKWVSYLYISRLYVSRLLSLRLVSLPSGFPHYEYSFSLSIIKTSVVFSRSGEAGRLDVV